MNSPVSGMAIDPPPLARLESRWLRLEVAPTVGGRATSLIHKPTGCEFLWRDRRIPLERLAPFTEYDPHFYGGIDELIPNDIPETIDGINCPDHGELWTTPLSWTLGQQGLSLTLEGTLPLSGLTYERQMLLDESSARLECKYRITNPGSRPRHFLWKLHAALAIQPGDVIECPARKGQVVDLAWSRYHTLTPFDWPVIEGQRADRVPPADGTVDFFYLYELEEGRLAWKRPSTGLRFEYQFDLAVFPFAWVFASYGGFRDHYTIVLEPCTAMPISVNDAAERGRCSVLEPGGSLQTRVAILAEALA